VLIDERVRAAVARALELDDEPEAAPAPVDPIIDAIEHARSRKAALCDVPTGRKPPTPLEHARPATMDGGARQPVPQPRDPMREHNELIWRGATAARNRSFL
jgi:hypothetical protein